MFSISMVLVFLFVIYMFAKGSTLSGNFVSIRAFADGRKKVYFHKTIDSREHKNNAFGMEEKTVGMFYRTNPSKGKSIQGLHRY